MPDGLGGVDGTRTHYLLIANQMLYQMSYYPSLKAGAKIHTFFQVEKSFFPRTYSILSIILIIRILYVLKYHVHLFVCIRITPQEGCVSSDIVLATIAYFDYFAFFLRALA